MGDVRYKNSKFISKNKKGINIEETNRNEGKHLRKKRNYALRGRKKKKKKGKRSCLFNKSSSFH